MEPVYVVDDDRDIRISLSLLLRLAGHAPRPFDSGTSLLEEVSDLAPGVVLLDLRMPGIDGIDVLKSLRERDCHWPVVVMTGHGDVSSAVRSMRLGAVDFLEKPFTDDDLMAALKRAAAIWAARDGQKSATASARALLSRLSPREALVFEGVAHGMSNKELGRQHGISPRTVEVYRANMMKKLDIKCVSDLVKLQIQSGRFADIEPEDCVKPPELLPVRSEPPSSWT